VVHRAKCKQTGEIVALKKIKVHKTRSGFPQSSLREINLLSQLKHENVIRVCEVVVDADFVDVFMVMEYAANDLQSIMHNHRKQNASDRWYWPLSQCKCLMWQLLSGVQYLHSMFVLHRDLKTSNLLLSNEGVLKICDFGMARSFSKPLEQYTNYVVTLWYRAPELLLATEIYGPPIDVWSVGCIFAELLTGKVLFDGEGEFQQINRIFALLGTPTEQEWPQYPKLPHGPNKFPWRIMKRKIDDKFPTTKDEHNEKKTSETSDQKEKTENVEANSSTDATCTDASGDTSTKTKSDEAKRFFTHCTVDLLKQLLTYDPAKRMSAEQALNHAFFSSELPPMTSKEDMPRFEEHHVRHTRKEQRPADVNKTNDNEEPASC